MTHAPVWFGRGIADRSRSLDESSTVAEQRDAEQHGQPDGDDAGDRGDVEEHGEVLARDEHLVERHDHADDEGADRGHGDRDHLEEERRAAQQPQEQDRGEADEHGRAERPAEHVHVVGELDHDAPPRADSRRPTR